MNPVPVFCKELGPSNDEPNIERRAKPGAGLGLCILLAILFWSLVLFFILG